MLICKVSSLFSDVYVKCPYYVVLYMQKVSLLCCALYAKCRYYVVLICKVSLLVSALYAEVRQGACRRRAWRSHSVSALCTSCVLPPVRVLVLVPVLVLTLVPA